MAYQRAQVEECMRKSIRYVRLKEGAQIFGMGLSKFQVLAREAKATYKVDKIVLVNIEIMDKYLQTFREV